MFLSLRFCLEALNSPKVQVCSWAKLSNTAQPSQDTVQRAVHLSLRPVAGLVHQMDHHIGRLTVNELFARTVKVELR
jgi:hypothetical protein